MRYRLFGLLCIFGCLSNVSAQVHEFKLDNGLKLLVKEDHRAPIVVSQVWYKVGASYESEGKTGLSHMLEHMMFKGTVNHPPGEFSRIMAANGASENAFTSTDYTAYFQTIAKNRLSLSFELEADRMRNLILQEQEFIKERNVVAEERRSRTEDDPDSVLYETFQATAYQVHPYRRPVIGWMNDIQNFQLSDLQAWYQRWYAPNNAIVVVTGDVNPQETFELAKKYFGDLRPSDITLPATFAEPQQLGMKRLIVKRPAKVASILLGYKVPSLTNIPQNQQDEGYALEMLQSILDRGNSARLAKNLVRGQEIASHVSASYDLYSRLEGLLLLSGSPTDKHTVAELETALKAEIAVLQNTLVSQEELERVKTQVKAAHVYELDSLFYQGMKLGSAETVGISWKTLDGYLEKISQVTPEQIQAVAKKYLIDDNLTIAVLEPLPLSARSVVNSPNISLNTRGH
jgi:zinc protease